MKYLFFWLNLGWSCILLGQIQHSATVFSNGGSIHSSGNWTSTVVVGQTAISSQLTTGPYEGNYGFLHQLIVDPDNLAPIAIAEEGPAAPLLEGTPFTLNGAESYDPEGQAITYFWSSLDGLSVADPFSAQPSITAPDVLAQRTYGFTLQVSDGQISSNIDTVWVTITDPDWIPVTYDAVPPTLYASVFVNEIPAAEGDLLAAFVGGENRGVGVVFLFQGVAYSVINLQGTYPTEVDFAVYQVATDQVCWEEASVFIEPDNNGDAGSVTDPIIIEATCENLWSAFSLSLQNACVGEVIEAQFTGSANAQTEFIWDFGEASILEGNGMGPYQLTWDDAGSHTVSLTLDQDGIQSNTASSSLQLNPTSDTTFFEIETCFWDEVNTEVITLSNVYGCDSIIVIDTFRDPDEDCMPADEFFNAASSGNEAMFRQLKKEERSTRSFIYPNPSTGGFRVVFPPSLQGKSVSLQIHDAWQRLVHRDVFQSCPNQLEMDFSSIPSGSYWVIIQSPEGRAIQKWVKI